MFVIIGRRNFERALTDALRDFGAHIDSSLEGIKSVADLSDRVKALRKQVDDLEIEKSKRTEEFERRERDIDHKVGLERKRQEFEIDAAKRETTVALREENLANDKKRFEEQMAFHEKRFTEEVGYLKDMLGQVIDRMPTAKFTGDLTPGRK